MKEKEVRFKYRVAGIALKNNRVLIQRLEKANYWSLPGGSIELLEKSGDALKREMWEETGIEVEVGRMVWVTENIFLRKKKQLTHEVAFYYIMHIKQQPVPPESGSSFYGDEQGKRIIFQWFDLVELSKIELYPEFLKDKLRFLPEGIERVIIYDI